MSRDKDRQTARTPFCATRRKSEIGEIPSVRNGAQYGENARKNSFLNYKSPVLSGRVMGAEIAETRAYSEATLYLSAHGQELFSRVLPSTRLS
jgi:hypothetical protein